uniref:Uncharacterized protein n=1 Tax=Arundo donax TaxID=35708 RepID=A0A0A8ZQV2_ARUDO
MVVFELSLIAQGFRAKH